MGTHLGLMMEEATIGENSSLIGKNLIDSHLRKDYGVIIVAIKKLSGDMVFNPSPSEKLEAGDVIVVICIPNSNLNATFAFIDNQISFR